jgi:hypothetical protein
MRNAVVKRPGQPAEAVQIDPAKSLEQLQGYVGGYIERATTSLDDAFTIWCNEEGLLCGLAPNVTLGGPIVGPVVVEGLADAEGNGTGLSDEQVPLVINMLNHMSIFQPEPDQQ